MSVIAQRVKALPGVLSVAFSEGIPIADRFTVELSPPARPDASQPTDVCMASPGFFEALGIPLLRGREFQLWEGSPVIVSRNLARALQPREDPLGKVLALPRGQVTAVGVARDIDPLRFGGSEDPSLYRAWRMHPIRNWMSARFDAGASTGAAAVRAAIRQADPNMLGMARLMQSWIEQVSEDIWNVVALIVILGVVATLLASAGIYGAVSFAVNRRSKECGIRVALGAQRLDIIREVFVSGGSRWSRAWWRGCGCRWRLPRGQSGSSGIAAAGVGRTRKGPWELSRGRSRRTRLADNRAPRTTGVDGLMAGRRLQVLRRQAGLLGQNLHGRGAKRDPVMVGKQHVGPTGARQDAVGGPPMPLAGPPDAEQRGERLLRLCRGPIASWCLRRQ